MKQHGKSHCETAGRLALLRAAVLTLLVCSMGSAALGAQPAADYVNTAPLPGAGVVLSQDGTPDGTGAMQLNIPIAYTPGAGYFDLGAFKGNHPHEFSSSLPNGSGRFAAGIGLRPRVYVSAMQVSGRIFRDSMAFNAQVQLIEHGESTPAFALGVQDITDEKSSLGEEAQSFYGVATRSLVVDGAQVHISLGYGSGRFMDTLFGGVSCPLGDHFNALAEWDGFQTSEALAWRPGGRFGNFTVLVGYNNKAGALVGGSLVFGLPRTR